jgi:uncharacterized protein (TIGR03437 family)
MHKSMKLGRVLLLLTAVAGVGLGQVPAWDTSGNGLLNGSYYFRQVYYLVGDSSGDFQGAFAIYGNINFDGNGHYALANATLISDYSNAPAPAAYTLSGTYSMSSSGFGFLSSLYCPYSSGCGTNSVYVTVSNGIVTGSSTESYVNDLFVAAAVPSPLPTNSAFSGTWNFAGYIPPPTGNYPSVEDASDVFFQMTPNGGGSLGTVNVTGYNVYINGAGVTTQSDTGMTYSFSSGAASITFPNNSSSYFFVGSEFFYFSPDGTFCFGGSNSYPDLVFGVRAPTSGTAPTLSGIYYAAGLDQNETDVGNGFADFDTFYGSLNASNGNIIESDRLNDLLDDNYAFTSSYYDAYSGIGTNGLYTEAGFENFAVNSSGTVRIGAGIEPTLSLYIAVQAPSLSGSGVYINPQGVVDAASLAPFTSGISPGEFVSLFGSGLASSNALASSLPLPTNLGNVQVKVDGISAPVDYVSPNQINFLVPFGISTLGYGVPATIEVINNNQTSNVVTEYVHQVNPGVFTNPPGGINIGAILHQDGITPVTEANPAALGETVEIFASGLGVVFPPNPDGAAGPASSSTTNTVTVEIGGVSGTLQFAGLAPGFAGLYQINVTVPSTAATGLQTLEVDGSDSSGDVYGSSAESLIPIGSGSTAASVSAQAVRTHRRPASSAIHKLRNSGLQVAR